MNLTELIARLEAAEEPSRELDCWIENNLGLARFKPDRPSPIGEGWLEKRVEPKPYTSSLDAAMTLVPKGKIARRYVVSRHVPHTWEVAVDYAHGGWIGHSDSSSPLALCIAAIRAHEPRQ